MNKVHFLSLLKNLLLKQLSLQEIAKDVFYSA